MTRQEGADPPENGERKPAKPARRRSTVRRKQRQRGTIDRLPSGSLRVRVYAGRDPISKRERYLTEVIPPTHANPEAEAERMLRALIDRVDEHRFPTTRATVDHLMEKYLDGWDGSRSTLSRYREVARLHINPVIGDQVITRIDAEIVDSFIVELRRCRVHCDRRASRVDHWTGRRHDCDGRCRRHVCQGLSRWTVLKVYWLLHAAFDKAVRTWKWLDHNPVSDISPPTPPPSKPNPPTTEQAALILNEAWRRDPGWGFMVWMTMVTGMRRGELCGVRRHHLELDRSVLILEKSVGVEGTEVYETDTKDHRQRRIVLDDLTVKLARAHLAQCEQRANELGLTLAEDMFVFSATPDHSQPFKPTSVTDRYRRMAAKLGIKTSIHRLRHYSATELIASGVDVRTVAGRLGHGGGGTTTLKVYAAFVSEADQRAAKSLSHRLPRPPVEFDDNDHVDIVTEPVPRGPYDRIAADLKAAIRCGALRPGDQLPTIKDLAARYQVAPSTVHRAFALLKDGGLVMVARGQRATVTSRIAS
ncbi:MAG: tyrosine-type recombinase/integrase [Nocardioides sp.]